MIFRLRVKFIFFLYDLLGCFLVILILRYYELFLEIVVCVFIYNGNGKLELVFGEGVLLFLKKVVCFSRKFFVLDVDSKSVKVFNKNGQFCWEIGNGMFEDLVGIIIDCLNGCVLVCDCEGYVVYVYNSEGVIVRII